MTLCFSIAGGNQEIIHILKEKEHSFEKHFRKQVKTTNMHIFLFQHAFNVITWIFT